MSAECCTPDDPCEDCVERLWRYLLDEEHAEFMAVMEEAGELD